MSTLFAMQSITLRIETEVLPLLSPRRRRHVEGVRLTIAALAGRFALDQGAADLVAMGHDIERERNPDELRALVGQHGIPCTAYELEHPVLLHGTVAAWRIAQWDPEISASVLTAIRHHTLGHPTLDTLGLALYVADYVEPHRRHLSDQERAAILSADSVASMVIRTVEHAHARFGVLHEFTEAMRRSLEFS